MSDTPPTEEYAMHRANMDGNDHEGLHQFLEGLHELVEDTLGEDAIFMVGLQYGQMLNPANDKEAGRVIVESNLVLPDVMPLLQHMGLELEAILREAMSRDPKLYGQIIKATLADKFGLDEDQVNVIQIDGPEDIPGVIAALTESDDSKPLTEADAQNLMADLAEIPEVEEP